jgi:hypothetical protein
VGQLARKGKRETGDWRFFIHKSIRNRNYVKRSKEKKRTELQNKMPHHEDPSIQCFDYLSE